MTYLQMFAINILLPLLAAAVTARLFSRIRMSDPPDSPRSKGLGSFLAVAVTALVVMGSASFGAGVLRQNGYGLFFSLPLLGGLFSSLLLATRGARSYGACVSVALLSVAGG